MDGEGLKAFITLSQVNVGGKP